MAILPRDEPKTLGGQGSRRTIGNEILDMAARIAERSNTVKEVAQSKLAPILNNNKDFLDDSAKTPQQMYPEYFELMRGHLEKIDKNIDSIENTISRVEI
jgi:hypothetical protein